MSFHVVKTLNLLLAHLSVVDFKDIDRILMVKTILVDTYDCLTTGVDTSLSACRSLFDTEFRQTGLDSLRHTAKFLDFLDVFPCAVSNLVGE